MLNLEKYEDLKGIASADISAGSSSGYGDTIQRLKDFIMKKGVDADVYHPVGIKVAFYSDEYHYSILCKKHDDITSIINLSFDPEMTADEFYTLVETYSSVVVDDSTVDLSKVKSINDETISSNG